ncbi:MAG TPA: methylmalonyl-CoA epimerase [Firmicutes bacterium]|nr:methylmalonyl-CoA epimerase [Bacillota bacterium]
MGILVQNLDHVGVQVANLKRSIAFYQEMLGLKLQSQEDLSTRGLKKAMLVAGSGIVELLEYVDEPVPNSDGPIAHMAFRVSDIDNAWAQLKKAGVKLVDEVPRQLEGGMKIAFLRGPDNELIELVQF